MIKVLIISEEGRGGGPLNRIFLMAQALRASIKYIIVLPKTNDAYISQLENEKLTYRTLPLHPLTRSLKGIFLYAFYFFYELYKLVQLIQHEDPDIIHANGSWQFKGVLAGRITKKKVVWHMNDSYQPSIVLWLFRMLSSIPSGYIFASQLTREYYVPKIQQELTKPNSRIIPAPVDSERIRFQKREKKALLQVYYGRIY